MRSALSRQPGFALFLTLTLASRHRRQRCCLQRGRRRSAQAAAVCRERSPGRDLGTLQSRERLQLPAVSPVQSRVHRLSTRAHALQDAAAWSVQSITVGGPGAEPERIRAAAVSANLFSLLRVSPMLGRTFTTGEDLPKAPAVAVLSSGYWRSRFGGEVSMVGRTVPINGVPTTIVGIMPDGFSFPGTGTRMWVPLGIDPASPGNRQGTWDSSDRPAGNGRFVRGRARGACHDHVGMESALPGRPHRPLPVHSSAARRGFRIVRPALIALLGATGFVLLIVCANVASLMLARGEARTREMAIRGALGAGGGRSAPADAARKRCARLVWRSSRPGLRAGRSPPAADAGSDQHSHARRKSASMAACSAFALVVSVVTAILAGLLPAIKGASPALQGTLRDTTLTTSAGANRQLLRRSLVTLEVALCVVLVLGAGLMIRSFSRLLAVDPGFRPSGVLMANISLPASGYPEITRVEAFYAALLARLRAVPGVRAASAASGVPLWSDAGVWDFEIEGRPSPRPGEMAWNAAAAVARDGFFETLGIPLVRGRFFTSHDDDHAMPVAVINEAMASRFFPGEDPIGRRISVKGADADSWMTIVGIAANIRDEALDTPPRPSYYLAQSQTGRTIQDGYRSMSVVMRIDGPPDSARTALSRIVHDLDPGLPVFDVQTVDAIIDRSVARPRFTTSLLALFAVVGVLLGATGIYGVLAYTVARSRKEIGIRRALGAPTAGLLGHVLVTGLRPVIAGLALGIVASFWSSRLLTTDLFGISPTDPSTYVYAVLAVIGISISACLVPARRALLVNPIVALRSE